MVGHTVVMVPEGHTVQVHPPGAMPMPAAPMPQAPGIIPDPAAMGAKQVMDAAIPKPEKKAAKKEAGSESARKKPTAKKGEKSKDR